MSIQGTQPHLDFRVPFEAARKLQKLTACRPLHKSPARRSNFKDAQEKKNGTVLATVCFHSGISYFLILYHYLLEILVDTFWFSDE